MIVTWLWLVSVRDDLTVEVELNGEWAAIELMDYLGEVDPVGVLSPNIDTFALVQTKLDITCHRFMSVSHRKVRAMCLRVVVDMESGVVEQVIVTEINPRDRAGIAVVANVEPGVLITVVDDFHLNGSTTLASEIINVRIVSEPSLGFVVHKTQREYGERSECVSHFLALA